MKVCIEKKQDGSFSVYEENEGAEMAQGGAAMGGESPETESSEQQNAQPARDIQSALMIAGKLLSQAPKETGDSPFDQGLKSVLPKRPGMGGM